MDLKIVAILIIAVQSTVKYLILTVPIKAKLFLFQASVIIINQYEVTFNKSISNLTFEHACDGKADCIVNCTITSFHTVEKMTLYVTVKIPENSNDRKYSKELVKTVVQLERYLNRKNGNHLVTAFLSHFLDSIDFEPALPFPPVSVKSIILIIISTMINFIFFQRTYAMKNIVIGDYFPIISTTFGMVDLKFVGKISGYKQSMFFCRMQFYGQAKR